MGNNGNNLRARVTALVERMRTAPRYVSVPMGVGLIIGGTILAPLPVFGFWMAPLGLAILAPHSPWAQRMSGRVRWQSMRLLKWAIRKDLVRVKRKGDAPPSAEN